MVICSDGGITSQWRVLRYRTGGGGGSEPIGGGGGEEASGAPVADAAEAVDAEEGPSTAEFALPALDCDAALVRASVSSAEGASGSLVT
jgi:hypothetical protein